MLHKDCNVTAPCYSAVMNTLEYMQNNKERLKELSLPESIIITSGSAIKIGAVKKLLAEIFPEKTFLVEGVKASSDVDEQPVRDMTERGALNRIRNAKDIVAADTESFPPDSPRMFISIENGIFGNSLTGWRDRAVVVIKIGNETFMSLSKLNVRYPDEYVKETQALEGGFEKNTVGSVLARRYAEKGIPMNPQDPHTTLTTNTKHPFTREDQILEALTDALLKMAW